MKGFKGDSRIVFFALTLGYLFALIPRFALAINSDQIADYFRLSPVLLGLLGSAYFYPYAAMQIPSGFLSDVIPPEKLVSLSLAAIAVGNLLFALAPNIWVAVTGRFLTGLGGSCIYVPALKYAASRFPPDKFSQLSGILIAVNGLCAVMVNGPLAVLSEVRGWRAPFLVSAFATALLSFLLLALVTNQGVFGLNKFHQLGSVAQGLKTYTRVAALNKLAWPLFLRSFLTYGVSMSFQSLWAGPYMMKLLGMRRTEVGQALLLMSLGTTVASPIGGFLSDKVFKARKPIVVWTTFLCALTWLPIVLFVDKISRPVLIIDLVLMAVIGGLGAAAQTAQVKEIFRPEFAGTALGLNNLFLTAGGAVLPLLFGIIVGSTLSNQVLQFRKAFFLNMACMLGAWITSCVSIETYSPKRPMARV